MLRMVMDPAARAHLEALQAQREEAVLQAQRSGAPIPQQPRSRPDPADYRYCCVCVRACVRACALRELQHGRQS